MASTLQFKAKFVFVFKTIWLVFLLWTALWWRIERRGGPLHGWRGLGYQAVVEHLKKAVEPNGF